MNGVPVLRRLLPDDLDALLEVQRAGAVAGLAEIFPQDRFPFPTDEIRARWEHELADPGIDCFVVVQDDAVAGFAATRGAELLHFGTAPATWGRGLAGAAHDEVLAHLRAQGHARVWLRVFDENHRAVRFYVRRGWVATSEVERSEYPPHAVLRRFERPVAEAAGEREGAVDVVVRDARAADVGEICRFGEAHIPPHYAPLIGEAAAAAQVRRWWDARGISDAVASGLVVVADAGGELVGVAQRGSAGTDHVVYKLYVHPAHRGRGIGPMLLAAVTERLPHDATRLAIEHFAGNRRAAEFYEREGFAVDRVEPSPAGNPALDVVWRSRPVGGPRRGAMKS